MRVGHLYELYVKFRRGQGRKERLVPILVINHDHDIAIELKIIIMGPTKNQPYPIIIEDNLSPHSVFNLISTNFTKPTWLDNLVQLLHLLAQ